MRNDTFNLKKNINIINTTGDDKNGIKSCFGILASIGTGEQNRDSEQPNNDC